MKILSASQIRLADAHTIEHEPISSIDLMERAAGSCVQWILKNYNRNFTFKIFCGPGNNGGDGCAIARMLINSGLDAKVFIVRQEGKFSDDFIENEKRLKLIGPGSIVYLETEKDFPFIKPADVIVDALFGTGLTRPVNGLFAKVIEHINSSGAKVISIDLPSGLFADEHSEGSAIIQADHTLSFQLPKLAFMFPENEKYVGEFHLLDIGLDPKFIDVAASSKYYLTKDFIQPILKHRKKFSHKGNYGHALIFAGSEGKMGAAVLAVKGCLRAGAGLVSVKVPEGCEVIMQISCPEAMLAIGKIDFKKYDSIGIGPGIGTDQEASGLLKKVLKSAREPIVLDADALNIISENKELLRKVPQDSILTPHPREFERLAGKSKNDFERHDRQIAFSKKNRVIIVLKGAHSCITTPDGKAFFNSTGNPGMAKGGSGDILTGMITSLLAQGYSPKESALLGVYLHGLAGDLAAEKKGMDGMIARDIVSAIPGAWKALRANA